MRNEHKKIEINSEETLQILDITDDIKEFVEGTGISNGLVNIQTMHTTATIFLNENEPLLLDDIRENLDRIAPRDKEYNHDNFDVRTVNMCDDECANGHSHCKAVYLPSSLTLNLIDGEVQFGQWQRVLFIELDRARQRKIQVHVIGE